MKKLLIKNLFIFNVLWMLSCTCFAGDTFHFYSSGTATTGASSNISILNSSSLPTVSNNILVLNDSTTNDIYVDLSGSLTEYGITSEAKAMTLKAGEYITMDFRTNKIKVRGKTGSAVYRIWALF